MWYRLSLEKVYQKLDISGAEGLSEQEAQERIKKGKNVLPEGKKKTWVQLLLRQFKSPLVYILLIGAILTAWLAEWIDMTVILLAVFVNVSVGFWQEFRSSNILKKLREIIQVRALVIRDSAVHEIDAKFLVPGDLILLKAGRKVPADARVISARHLRVDEALLTGESASIEKKNITIEANDAVVGDRTNMVHMGTIITRGEGRAVVVDTGASTEIGTIALLTQQAEDEPTPLQIKIGKLGKILAIFVAIAAVIIFVVGVFEDHTFREMFITAIAVAVAAIPEGLPAAISIVLAVSAQRILRRKGVVKNLVGAETLGSASVICTDKTGTLTEGRMAVKKLILGSDRVDSEEDEYLKEQAQMILALSNEALIEQVGEEQIIRGDTTDQAKMRAFLDEGGNIEKLLDKYPRVELLQFNSERNYIASLHRNTKTRGHTIFVSGAPETIIDLSNRISKENRIDTLTESRREDLRRSYEEYAKQGYRMIALARSDVTVEDSDDEIDLEDEETRHHIVRQLEFIGLAAIRDPIRKDVKESIKVARDAGVRSIMLTGDHLLTARSIGHDLGFSTELDAVMEGKALDSISDIEFEKRIKKIEIFARVNPAHKMRIVDMLQKQGEVVAMTGDGVNDAPALKSSDIGVALESGTDVSKEASDLVLLNNSFTIIVSAIKQGRIAFDNIRKVTVFLLAGSFTELILIMSALLLKLPLPITAVQILWTNLVEDTLPNVALSFEPGEKDIMKRPPLKKNEQILDSEGKIIIFIVGIFTDLLLLGLFLFLYYLTEMPLEHIRTFVFAALGLDTFFYIYSIKSLRKPIYSYNIFSNPYLLWATVIGVGVMLAAIYIPFLNLLLGTVPLTLANWVIIFILGIINILGVETAKWWFFGRKKTEQSLVVA